MPLRLWRRKDGRSGNWYVMGTVSVWRDGRKRSVTIKPESTGTADKDEAAGILTQIASRYQRGNIENRDAPPTVADLINAYLDAGKSDRYLLPIVRALGDLEVTELNQARIDADAWHSTQARTSCPSAATRPLSSRTSIVTRSPHSGLSTAALPSGSASRPAP